MARIDCNHIRHAYGPNPKSPKDYALKEVHHTFEDGGAYALLGPSGCGKTTLLNIISGLLHPSHGELLFDGRDVTHLSTQERNIAQVFQFPVIYDTMTVYDNLAFPLRNRARAGGRRRPPRARDAGDDRPGRYGQAPGEGADRRPEAEDLARPRAGAPRRQRHPVRRAAHRHRSAYEMGAALAAEAASQALRLHNGLRHARSDRGAHLRRACRRHV